MTLSEINVFVGISSLKTLEFLSCFCFKFSIFFEVVSILKNKICKLLFYNYFIFYYNSPFLILKFVGFFLLLLFIPFQKSLVVKWFI